MKTFLLKQSFNQITVKAVYFFLFLIIYLAKSGIAQVPMIRLQMHGLPNYQDETVIYYQAGATEGFDSEYDAYKLSGPNSVPQISQEYDSLLMVINGIEPVSPTFSINIKATTNVTRNYTITATDFNFLPIGTCVKLNDLVTGASVNILAGPYVFNLSNTTNTSRFVLEITHYELPVVSELVQPTCQLLNGGKFKINGATQGPWNYTWKDSTGAVIQTSVGLADSDSLSGLYSGNYTVEVTSVSNSCYSNVTSFAINEKSVPAISFTSPDTIVASVMHNFLPSNASSNCELFSWEFGDGSGYSADFEPAHTYSIPGHYKVTLKGTSNTGCTDSTTKFVGVIDLATSVKTSEGQLAKLLNTGDNLYVIKLNNALNDDITVNLYNLQGKSVVSKYIEVFDTTDHINLDLNNLSQGVYILNMSNSNTTLLNSKLFVK